MADTTTTTTEVSSADTSEAQTGRSLWGESLNLTSLKADPKRWDQEWERVLDTLSAQKAYTRMGRLFKKGIWDKPGMTLERLTGYFTEDACKMQGVVLEIWRKDGLGEHLVTAWALLEYSEHERHLLEGLKEASERCPFHQDIRSLCPEIRTSLLLARSGRAFTDFVETFVEGKEAVGDATIPYLFPSAWWNKAGDDMPESMLEEFDESSLTLLTLLRNDYIGRFLFYSGYDKLIIHSLSPVPLPQPHVSIRRPYEWRLSNKPHQKINGRAAKLRKDFGQDYRFQAREASYSMRELHEES